MDPDTAADRPQPRYGSGPSDPNTIFGGQGGGPSPPSPGGQSGGPSAPTPMYGGGGGRLAPTPVYGGGAGDRQTGLGAASAAIDMRHPMRQDAPRNRENVVMERWEASWAQQVVTEGRARGEGTLDGIQLINYRHAQAVLRGASGFRGKNTVVSASSDDDEDDDDDDEDDTSSNGGGDTDEDSPPDDTKDSDNDDDDARATRISYTGEVGQARRIVIVENILEQVVDGDGGHEQTCFHRGARTACVEQAHAWLQQNPPIYNGTPLFPNGLTVPQMKNVFTTTIAQAAEHDRKVTRYRAGGENGGSVPLNTGPLAELYLKLWRKKQEVEKKTAAAKRKRSRDKKMRKRREKIALMTAFERKQKERRRGKKRMDQTSSGEDDEHGDKPKPSKRKKRRNGNGNGKGQSSEDDGVGCSSSGRATSTKKFPKPKNTPAKEANEKFDQMLASLDEQLARDLAAQEQAAAMQPANDDWGARLESLPTKLKDIDNLLERGVITEQEHAGMRARALEKLV